jgi:N-hydroxyarylamine O-acetyltransferase
MNLKISQYLQRINYPYPLKIDNQTLIDLHKQHVFHIPFENLDIVLKKPVVLEINQLFEKVIMNNRGGFCYELNYLFNSLLSTLGFKSRIISARIYDEYGNSGPEFDHMAILVEADKKYLVDVGFGDLFLGPLEIIEGMQTDGDNQFTITKIEDGDFLLKMCSDGINFLKKYRFSLSEVQVEDFAEICSEKQTSSTSYFVKNTICTKPIDNGRRTIFNNRLIEKTKNHRIETLISDDSVLLDILLTKFNISNLEDRGLMTLQQIF